MDNGERAAVDGAGPGSSGGTEGSDRCPGVDDPRICDILTEYHRRGITDKYKISLLLSEEHGIKMSARTVTRRRGAFGLKASGATTRELADTFKRQLVLDELERHPSRQAGPRRIRERIANATGVHLTREFITNEMRAVDAEGFELRKPKTKKPRRTGLVSLGPHHEWSADGHDKLSRIGFPIYGFRDVCTAKFLKLLALPNNRLKLAIAYLYLMVVKEQGGVPLQSTTDCGSETTLMYGLANALREAVSPDLPTSELPAHRFLRSVHNITIERGWIPVRHEVGDNVHVFWEAGADVYDANDEDHYILARWLFSILVQRELDTFVDSYNNHRIRKDRRKALPSGMSPNEAMVLYKSYGGIFCLQPVDPALIDQLMVEIGGEDLLRFVSVEYETRALEVYRTLGLSVLNFQNVWTVFQDMLPHMAENVE
ncbi:hypothetical protein EUX98_g6112 [Antrodiella citrinella]|uniref:Integrase core domain-containing protein n=1 Tax=Antrodiella citrinella TaxID=2447956 RepID=A0A4S4MQ39_9APHY|nr:hypothetical protein EUX98_g6112 [Antrodiella citrinella]